jgi:hypothetical protein
MSEQPIDHPLNGKRSSASVTQCYDGRYYVSIVIGPLDRKDLADAVVESFATVMRESGASCRIDGESREN